MTQSEWEELLRRLRNALWENRYETELGSSFQFDEAGALTAAFYAMNDADPKICDTQFQPSGEKVLRALRNAR
jgi:hypothetical protein